jgi:hypothetical protein
MMKNFTQFIVFSFFCLTIRAQEIPFDPTAYTQRKEQIMTRLLTEYPNNEPTAVVQAYKGLPVSQSVLDYFKQRAETSGEFDFNLIQMVRILFFSDGQYDDQILPLVDTIPLWLTPNENLRVYWSENHIIMWLSSAYLLKQKYGLDVVPNLEKNIEHYLDLKINYGFYEFFSSTYFPFTLGGLLNLVDFADDTVIKQKAILATERLLKETLLLANDRGVFFPAAGRNYAGRYESIYGQGAYFIIHALTGLGVDPVGGANAGSAMLLTSSFDPRNVVESWKSKEDRVLKIGHTLQEGFALNSVLSNTDKTIFQWSSGAYFHPDVAAQTYFLISNYDLWDHKEFRAYNTFKGLPLPLVEVATNVAASISKSSLICGQDVAIFKDKSVTLSSIQNYFKGRAGYQQWPWAAAVGETAVYTNSGDAAAFLGGSLSNANSTLPYIEQKSNVALIMYRANKDLALFGINKHDVSLFWEEDKFDEVAFDRNWIIGRAGDSYVAVLRFCTDQVNGVYTCKNQDGQLWSVIVGNSDMYGSFDHFKQIVADARYKGEWIFRPQTLEWTFYGMIDIDGIFLEHYWDGNLLSFPQNPNVTITGIQNLSSNEGGFTIFPNPASGQFTLSPGALVKGAYVVRIHDITGRQMYASRNDAYSTPNLVINTSGWAGGMYSIIVETPQGIMSRKLMVQGGR